MLNSAAIGAARARQTKQKRNSVVHPTKHQHSPSKLQKKLRMEHMVNKMPKQEHELCEETFEEIDGTGWSLEGGSGWCDYGVWRRELGIPIPFRGVGRQNL